MSCHDYPLPSSVCLVGIDDNPPKIWANHYTKSVSWVMMLAKLKKHSRTSKDVMRVILDSTIQGNTIRFRLLYLDIILFLSSWSCSSLPSPFPVLDLCLWGFSPCSGQKSLPRQWQESATHLPCIYVWTPNVHKQIVHHSLLDDQWQSRIPIPICRELQFSWKIPSPQSGEPQLQK
jgi:hypothetical protein